MHNAPRRGNKHIAQGIALGNRRRNNAPRKGKSIIAQVVFLTLLIPILVGNYQMPKQEMLPDKLKELALKNAPEFSFSYFEEYLNKLVEKGYITSEAQLNNKATSVFKFYSNENCTVLKEGKLVCSLEGMADEPFICLFQERVIIVLSVLILLLRKI